MTNVYEQMLLNDKTALESKIANLVEEQLNNNAAAEAELNLVSKVIDYAYAIKDTCSFEVDDPHIRGYKHFGSIEDYKEREDLYDFTDAAENDGVVWWDDTAFPGSFSWDGRPEVCVRVKGLTEDASKEAKTLWEAQRTEGQRQEQLVWKRKQLEEAQKQLLKLQAELSAAEATA